jgi:hypothetical protein
MALNPSIALGVKGIEVANPLAQYAQVAQIQSMQNQNQVSQMQLDQMRRDDETLKQIQAKAVEHGGPADLNQIADAYLKSGNPKFVEFGIGLRQKLDERDQVAKIMSMGRPPAAAPATNALAPTMQAGALGSGTFGMAPEPRVNQLAPAAAPAPAANALVAPGGLDLNVLLAQRKAFIAMGKPDMARALDAEIALASREPTYQNVPGVGLVDPRNARVVVPSVEPTDPEIKRYEYAKAQGYRGSLFDFKREMANAGRTPAQPAQPSAPVAVVDESGRVKYVTREQAMGMTPATAIEGLSPKEIQKREAVLPQARQAVKTVGNTMSVIGETVDRLLANPEGLNGITGTIYGRTPAFTDAANTANADLEQLRNLAFVQGLTELRAASKTGAGVGNVSNREGERFENLKASLDRRQSKTDLENALRRLKEQASFTTQTMQEAFDETYKYKQTAPAPAATQGTGGFKYLGKESGK